MMRCFSAKAALTAVATSLVLLLASSQTQAQSYTVIDLGVYNTTQHNNGTYSEAWGISENGHITGLSTFKVAGPPFPNSDDYRPTAFLWTPTTANGSTGSLLNLKAGGSTQGNGYRDPNTSIGMDVNNAGVVIGANFNTGFMYASGDAVMGNNSFSHAAVFVPNTAHTDSTLYDLGVFINNDGSGYSSGGWAITNSGVAYGGSNYMNFPFAGAEMGFVYSVSAPYPALNIGTNGIGSLSTKLYGANETNNQAVGENNGVLLYNGGTMINLGHFGGSSARGNGINNSGVVVGNRTMSNNFKVGFVWTPTIANGTTGTYVDIGPYIDSLQRQWNVVPNAVNSSGVVVGYIWREDSTNRWEAAFRWKASTGLEFLSATMSSMPQTGWQRTRANDINDAGQIVGFGSSTIVNQQGYARNYGRAFLLQP